MNENEFEYDGQLYVAKPVVYEDGKHMCEGCAFFPHGECVSTTPSCLGHDRADKQYVIYVKKEEVYHV